MKSPESSLQSVSSSVFSSCTCSAKSTIFWSFSFIIAVYMIVAIAKKTWPFLALLLYLIVTLSLPMFVGLNYDLVQPNPCGIENVSVRTRAYVRVWCVWFSVRI